jgi:hypothetical protein
MAGSPVRRARREAALKEAVAKAQQDRLDALPRPYVDEDHKRSTVRGDFKYLARYYFRGQDGEPYRLQDYHVEILEAMFEGGYLIVNVPTDHMKSSLGCFLFPLFSLMEDPDESHIICGATVNDSKRRVQTIERELESNKELIKDFPWMGRPEERDSRIWTATQFNVSGRTKNKPNPSVLASAIGSNDLKGRRGKLIMDDIEGEDVIWSPTKRMQMESWLKLEAWRCFENKNETDRPLLCLMGTPFDVDSIYFRMEKENWRVIRHRCYLDGGLEPDQPTRKRVYLWPEQAEKVEKARRDLGTLAFSVAYLMDPTGGDPTRLSEPQIRARISEAAPIEADHSTGFISLDPATGGVGRRLDYAGIAAVKVHWLAGHPLPQVDVMECYNFRQGLFEQVHFCADLALKYGFPVLIESNSQQGGTYTNTFRHLRSEVKPLLYYTSGTNKFDDAMGLTVIKRLVMEKMLFVEPELMDSEGVKALVAEVRDLIPPFNQHNHISMALWIAVRYVYERSVRYYQNPPIKLTYAMNPLQALSYQDDASLPPLQRAYQAIGYDRAARQGTPMIIGYTAFRRQMQMPWDRSIQEEEEKFQQALRKLPVTAWTPSARAS